MSSPGASCLDKMTCCGNGADQVPEVPRSFAEVDAAPPYSQALLEGVGGSDTGRQLFEVLMELQRCIEPALAALRDDKGQFSGAELCYAGAATASLVRAEPLRAHERTPRFENVVASPEVVVETPAAGEARSTALAEVKFEMPLPDEPRPKDSDADAPVQSKASSATTGPALLSGRFDGSMTQHTSRFDGSMTQHTAMTVDSRAPIGRVHGAGRASRYSAPAKIDAPMRALVINVRKLVDAQEKLHMLHVLINSTAIAAVTLANAGSQEQFRCTLWFGICSMVTFVMHESHWDLLEVGDFRLLLPMLSDDEDGGRVNPNRLLKAMSVSECRFWNWIYAVVHTLGLFVGTFAWLMIENWWQFSAGQRDDTNTLLDRWRAWFVASEEDGLVLGMQVSVGSLMFILHIIFEAYHYQETCAVMPRTQQKGIWDPRVDGVPLRFRLFGLPGLWFTSKEALDDFKHWVDNANATRRVVKIYPQEMAQFAMCGSAERQEVQLALKYSKLFDGQRREFVDRHGRGSEEELDIELTFFDEALKNKECPFPGEFLTIVDGEEEEASRTEGREPTGSQDLPSLPVGLPSASWKNRQALGMMRGR